MIPGETRWTDFSAISYKEEMELLAEGAQSCVNPGTVFLVFGLSFEPRP